MNIGASTSQQRSRVRRYNSTELLAILEESSSDEGEFVASDNEHDYIPLVEESRFEISDVEPEAEVENEIDSYDSDASFEGESLENILIAKDGTRWQSEPLPRTQTSNRNILRQRGGAASFSKLYNQMEIFKNILSNEMCDIILRETNRKGTKVTEAYNNRLMENYPDISKRPKQKIFKPFTEQELDAFFGILIFSGVHRSNKEHLTELWKSSHLPLFRAAMSHDRFKMLLRFIRFDNDVTRLERLLADKAAAIRDIWTMFISNLKKLYKPRECITVDKQLYGYRGRTRFTQYMPSKPEKYGIKIFWACDANNSYPLNGLIYTGKSSDGMRQTNVGECTVLDLVAKYKNSGLNVTTDNFFTSLQLAHSLNSWNMTLVGTVRKNKRFLPANMQAHKERSIYSSNFAFSKAATVCSYVPKKKKAVIMLSSMHMSPVIESYKETAKPEIILYYNKTKSGVDNMDKLLAEYTVKRRTNRWPLALFYNIIDIAALAAYIIYMEHNPQLTSSDRRRKFLKSLSLQLCSKNIEERSKNCIVTSKLHVRSAMQDVLGRELRPSISSGPTTSISQTRRDSTGRVAVVGSCYLCRELKRKQRKTRKACTNCRKPICDEHAVTRPTCNTCFESCTNSV
ncbi:piggyBac transposable element-derived protein 1-like [Vanessa atalanta]|uniref:piggyBac transposable element-derived protein 1-like n=1 Tax=Vanessa atalanta TaxID=42275 RepID=UPI001FCD7245|nr:piggyBac transposable element-derived protein 1-like [Vanessa atalanta]